MDLAAFAEGAPEEMDEGMTPEEGAEEELSPEEKYARLIPLLQENDDEVTDAYDALDQALVTDDAAPMEEDDRELLLDGYEELAPELKTELQQCCPGMSPDDASWVAGQVDTADPERLTAWLYRLGQALSEPAPEEGEGEMGEESPEEAPGQEGQEYGR
jgi:hypothetical protein